MTHGSLSPGFVKIRYTGVTYTHIQTIPVEPSGSPVIGTEPNFLTKAGTPLAMSTCINAYVALAKTLVSAAITFVDAEYWDQPVPEDDPYWVYTHPIAVVGTHATASVADRQQSISFRTGAGGLAFNYLLEISGAFPADARQNFPTGSAPVNALKDYLIGNTSWCVGRDGGFYVTPVWYTTKNNDSVRKKMLGL
jgi:hypothetical protein